eukprot:TRINITY_DN1871_c0_g1_i6.p1 TRINITY_DN1871_c0_g1~~TRINITY_DN1871_c0_g1_i6.p1  ORF type:complete len:1012 (-),score=61.72 TRINITY_DN1871_c0_g1_i6:144-2993(-)
MIVLFFFIFTKLFSCLTNGQQLQYGNQFSDLITQRKLLQISSKTDCRDKWVCPPCVTINLKLHELIQNNSCIFIQSSGDFACGDAIVDSTLYENILGNKCYQACEDASFNMCTKVSIQSINCDTTIDSAYYWCGETSLSPPAHEKLSQSVGLGNCQILEGFNMYACDGVVLSSDLFQTVSRNVCNLKCISNQQECSQQCQEGEYICRQNSRLSTAVFAALKASPSCVEDVEPQYCMSQDLMIVEKEVYSAVQEDSCEFYCPANDKQDTCPVEMSLSGQSLGFKGYELLYGDYTRCSKECDHGLGGGLQERVVHCIEKSTGLPVELGDCDVTIEPNIANLSISCGTEQCEEYYWDYGRWGECSGTCALLQKDGTFKVPESKRTAVCRRMTDNLQVGRDTAEFQKWCAENSPQLTRPCNSESCEYYAFEIGPWSACQYGIKHRDIKCVSNKAKKVSVLECVKNMEYIPPTTALCGNFGCLGREQCGSRGRCQSGKCVCDYGYSGVQCEISNTTCGTGVVDKLGKCCQSGVVSTVSGTCCEIDKEQQSISLDKFGSCCYGYLNALSGECNKDYQQVDMLTGEGCAKGLTASGRCALNGSVVDQFGVADGNARSGRIIVNFSSQYISNNTAKTKQELVAAVAKALQVGVDQIQAKDTNTEYGKSQVITQSTRARSLLQQANNEQQLHVSPPFQYDMTYGLLFQKLQNTIELDNFEKVISIEVKGIDGNGICEIGEQGKSSDCEASFELTPVGRGDAFCSGQGNPLHASGRCLCWAGYDGDACQICAEGFYKMNGYCQASLALLNSSHAYNNDNMIHIPGILRKVTMEQLQGQYATSTTEEYSTVTAGSDVGLIIGVVFAGLVVVVAGIALYTMVSRRRRHAASSFVVTTTADESIVSGGSWTFTNPETEQQATEASTVAPASVSEAEDTQRQIEGVNTSFSLTSGRSQSEQKQ